jgi:hypothetical protein
MNRNDKAARRWSYLLHGNVCVSLIQDEADDSTIGLYISTPKGAKECYSMRDADAFIDECMAGDFFSETQH